MGHQWGLGMLWNAGEGTNILSTPLDSDFQSEVDRIQLVGKFKGVFFGVSWDFANKGYPFIWRIGVLSVNQFCSFSVLLASLSHR